MVREARRVLWRSGRLKYLADGADDLLVRDMLRAALRELRQDPTLIELHHLISESVEGVARRDDLARV